MITKGGGGKKKKKKFPPQTKTTVLKGQKNPVVGYFKGFSKIGGKPPVFEICPPKVVKIFKGFFFKKHGDLILWFRLGKTLKTKILERRGQSSGPKKGLLFFCGPPFIFYFLLH